MTTRTIGTITIASIASSSIRTIGAIVKICKRLNGNHSHMPWTIEAIQMFPKMHQLFQDSMLFLHCIPKNAFQNGTANTSRLPLALYALFYRTPAKIMLPPQAQTVQYCLLRRSRRLYGNYKSPLSSRSSGSLQKNFETIGTITWKPAFMHHENLVDFHCCDFKN